MGKGWQQSSLMQKHTDEREVKPWLPLPQAPAASHCWNSDVGHGEVTIRCCFFRRRSKCGCVGCACPRLCPTLRHQLVWHTAVPCATLLCTATLLSPVTLLCTVTLLSPGLQHSKGGQIGQQICHRARAPTWGVGLDPPGVCKEIEAVLLSPPNLGLFLVSTITNPTQEHQATGSFHHGIPIQDCPFCVTCSLCWWIFSELLNTYVSYFFFFKLLLFVAGVLPWAGCGSETADIPVSRAGQLVFLTPAGSTRHDDGKQLLVILQPILLIHKGFAKLGKFFKILAAWRFIQTKQVSPHTYSSRAAGMGPMPLPGGQERGSLAIGNALLCHGCWVSFSCREHLPESSPGGVNLKLYFLIKHKELQPTIQDPPHSSACPAPWAGGTHVLFPGMQCLKQAAWPWQLTACGRTGQACGFLVPPGTSHIPCGTQETLRWVQHVHGLQKGEMTS